MIKEKTVLKRDWEKNPTLNKPKLAIVKNISDY